jgi:hypothetical protein
MIRLFKLRALPNGRARMAQRFVKGGGDLVERLARAELPSAVQSHLMNTLTVLLEDDEETVPPDSASFMGFLNFFTRHRDFPLPSIGVNQNGRFVVVWQNPACRLSYEFLPNGDVFWASTQRRHGRIFVEDGVAHADAIPSDFACLRGTPAAPSGGLR